VYADSAAHHLIRLLLHACMAEQAYMSPLWIDVYSASSLINHLHHVFCIVPQWQLHRELSFQVPCSAFKQGHYINMK
jgi:hypothetical protein